MGFFVGRPSLPWNLGMVQLPVWLLKAWVMLQILALSPQLVGALLPFSIKPSFPQNSLAARPPSQLTGDWRGLSSSSNQPGGMQYFSLPGKPSWGSFYPLGLFLAWCPGSTQVLQGPPSGVASSAVASSMGGSGGQLSTLRNRGGLCTGEWMGLSSSKALQCLMLCPWDLLLQQSQLQEWAQASCCPLVMEWLSLSILSSKVAVAVRAL